jgi:rare lipoprotein A
VRRAAAVAFALLVAFAAGAVRAQAEAPQADAGIELEAGPASENAPATEAGPASESAPAPQPTERELAQGMASWYGPGLHGRRTASGERFDQHALTAAHRSLPFGTIVRVRSLVNGKTVDVRINDRGPFLKRRIIDLSRAAASALGLIESRQGVKRVAISVLETRAL